MFLSSTTFSLLFLPHFLSLSSETNWNWHNRQQKFADTLWNLSVLRIYELLSPSLIPSPLLSVMKLLCGGCSFILFSLIITFHSSFFLNFNFNLSGLLSNASFKNSVNQWMHYKEWLCFSDFVTGASGKFVQDFGDTNKGFEGVVVSLDGEMWRWTLHFSSYGFAN